jgi:guanine deaminase
VQRNEKGRKDTYSSCSWKENFSNFQGVTLIEFYCSPAGAVYTCGMAEMVKGEQRLIVIGSIVHAVAFGELEMRENVCITVNVENGKIEAIGDDCDTFGCRVIRLSPDQFLCPGFIDTHHHAPQTANLGLGLDRELLGWLETYTFPREASFGVRDEEGIAREYREMARRLLRNGTTCCVYFGSVQGRANEILVDCVAASGQRAFIGKVCMDQNSPGNYGDEGSEAALQGTSQLIAYIARHPENSKGLIAPVVTPRFAPTCTEKLMEGLGSLARQHDCHIQTHISENASEIAWVRSLFPNSPSYAHVYDSAGLLTPKTILAHAIHLQDTEKDLIALRGSSVSHCPNSNFALNSGCLDIRDLLHRNIKVSLGTDVSGGYSTSMIDACRQAIIASKVIHFQNKTRLPLTAAEAFSLATLNGAQCLGLQESLGNFKIGKKFDALVINVHANPQIPQAPENSQNNLQDLFEKFIFCGDDRCIERVFVNGSEII